MSHNLLLQVLLQSTLTCNLHVGVKQIYFIYLGLL